MDKIGFKGVYQPPLPPPPPTTWDILIGRASGFTIALDNPEEITIDWGDGVTNVYTTGGNKYHGYAIDSGDTRTIKISGSVLPGGNIRIGVGTWDGGYVKATGIINGVTGFTVNAFYRTFYGCNLQYLPADLFRYQTGVTSGAFVETFRGCSFLKEIPAGLFDYQSGVTTGSFLGTFKGCLKAEGNAPALWTAFPDASNGAACYQDCTKLTNYAGIPAAWK